MLVENYYEWSDAFEVEILDWIDPSGNYQLNFVTNYPLTDFASIYAITIGYLFVVVLTTVVMKLGIPPLKTNGLQLVYNFSQVMCCSYLFVEAIVQAYHHNYSILPCNTYNPTAPVMGNLVYLFYLTKILDLGDTIFVIAGKKWAELTIFHVYNHTAALLIYFVMLRVAMDGDIYFAVLVNAIVQTIMYTYDFLSAHTSTIWWKKYLRKLQMFQLILLNGQGFAVLYRGCLGEPSRMQMLYFVYLQSLFWLFVKCCFRGKGAKHYKEKHIDEFVLFKTHQYGEEEADIQVHPVNYCASQSSSAYQSHTSDMLRWRNSQTLSLDEGLTLSHSLV